MLSARPLLLSLLLVSCGGRPVGVDGVAFDPGSPDEGEGPPGMLACHASAQLVAAAVTLDGSVNTIERVDGWVGAASSGAPPGGEGGGFANHQVSVRYVLADDEEVHVFLALDRVLAIGESVEIDPGAPGRGGLTIARGSGWDDEVSTVAGDLFAGWARIARSSEHDFTASFCLLGWRDGASTASFTWARASLPDTIFSFGF